MGMRIRGANASYHGREHSYSISFFIVFSVITQRRKHCRKTTFLLQLVSACTVFRQIDLVDVPCTRVVLDRYLCNANLGDLRR